MAEIKQAQSFIEAIQQGSLPPLEKSPVVVETPYDEKKPSALGGLAALGATIVGATVLGKRIPGVRNYLRQMSKPAPKVDYLPSRPVGDKIPTATGQATDLIVQRPKTELAVVGRSRFGEVLQRPLNFGKELQPGGRIFGSSTYDRALEAPFDKAPAGKWIQWFKEANRGDLTYPGGPLHGVSRRVNPEELSDLNLVNFDKTGQPVSGFLKTAKDQGIEIDRESILNMIKQSPLANIKTIRLGAGKDPVGDFATIAAEGDDIARTTGINLGEFHGVVQDDIRKVMNASGSIPADNITMVQTSLKEAASKAADLDKSKFSNLLIKYNQAVGKYNASSKTPPLIQGEKDLSTYFPKNKSQRSYHLDGGENFTEDVIYYDGPLPNISSRSFKYLEGGPHYLSNSNRELAFVRYDDLPNPKLGVGKRHLRVSEVQSDLHSPQFSTSQSVKDNYFKNKVSPFNQDANLKLLQTQRQDIVNQLAPYQELGRGRMGLTRTQTQQANRLKYKLDELDRSALSSLIKQGSVDSTTGGPFSRSYNDMAVKNLLRTMAERDINAISIVPSSMNQNIKMFEPSKFGNELNYGLQNGKAAIKNKATGQMKKLSQYSSLNESLRKQASQYGAKFELFPMPKSNPLKEFKIIDEISTANHTSYKNAVESGRAIFNRKIGSERIFDNHVGAANSQVEAEAILKAYANAGSTRGKLIIKQMGPDNPDNYEMVATLIADSNVLKKFLLPQRAYMNTGGLVDTTNVFQSVL
tara:strand:- start:315 stop:2570 length:2256 start_codon:yes stop_codon:yes gene_type:complete